MQYRTTQAFLPSSWILVILTVLCCGMFGHQEPVTLGAQSREASAPSTLEAQDGIQDMFALSSPKWQQPVLHPHEKTSESQQNPTLFFAYSPSSVLGALPVALFSEFYFSQSLPALWQGFDLSSRSPPNA